MAYWHISLPQPFVQEDPMEWFRRFEICSKTNAWDDAARAAKLPTLLEGEALAIWLELAEDEQGDYEVAKQTLHVTERLSLAETVPRRGIVSLAACTDGSARASYARAWYRDTRSATMSLVLYKITHICQQATLGHRQDS